MSQDDISIKDIFNHKVDWLHDNDMNNLADLCQSGAKTDPNDNNFYIDDWKIRATIPAFAMPWKECLTYIVQNNAMDLKAKDKQGKTVLDYYEAMLDEVGKDVAPNELCKYHINVLDQALDQSKGIQKITSFEPDAGSNKHKELAIASD